MSSFSIFLASLSAAFSWEGLQTGFNFCQFTFSPAHAKNLCRWGRKPALLVSILASSGGELIGALMPEFWSYAASRWQSLDAERGLIIRVAKGTPNIPVCRFVTGAGQQGIFNTAFSLSFEIIGPALRLAGYIFYLIAIHRVSFRTFTFAGHLLRLVL